MNEHETTPADWTPSSWRAKPDGMAVSYHDAAQLERVVRRLGELPPLVTSGEIERLRGHVAEAQAGKRFLLQGGDCAEALSDCRAEAITSKLKIMLQMSLVLVFAGKKPVIRVGRIAGQYAKPRSSATETKNGRTLPSYFGDLINRPEFDESSRRPDPGLLLEAYQHAGLTLNFIRSLIAAGATAVINVVLGSLAGYSLARIRFPGQRSLLMLYIGTRMVPGVALIVPLYLTVKTYGLLDSLGALIVTYLTFTLPFTIWLMKNYFQSIPRELEEAALVDGCRWPQMVMRVLLPAAAPGLVADVIVSKLVDHLPLYRQEQRYARQGFSIARSTLCGWLQPTRSSGLCSRLITCKLRQ